MSEALDEGGDGLLRPRGIRRDTVANVQNKLPVLARKVLVRGLHYGKLVACGKTNVVNVGTRTHGVVHRVCLRAEHI